jgi:hypothetical protein
MKEDRSITTQPPVHPESMRHFREEDTDDKTLQNQKMDNMHQIDYDMMAKDIKDNEDIIQEIWDNQSKDNIDWGSTWGQWELWFP